MDSQAKTKYVHDVSLISRCRNPRERNDLLDSARDHFEKDNDNFEVLNLELPFFTRCRTIAANSAVYKIRSTGKKLRKNYTLLGIGVSQSQQEIAKLLEMHRSCIVNTLVQFPFSSS